MNLSTKGAAQLAAPNTISFTGSDVTFALVVNDKYYIIDNMQSISISTHTARTPIRPLGFSTPKTFVQGTTTIAGTMIMITTHQTPLFEILNLDGENIAISMDSFPSFDLIIMFTNESNDQISISRLNEITIMDTGWNASVNDMITESTFQFMARQYTGIQKMSRATANGNQTTFAGSVTNIDKLRNTVSQRISIIVGTKQQIEGELFDDWYGDDTLMGQYNTFLSYLNTGSGSWSVSNINTTLSIDSGGVNWLSAPALQTFTSANYTTMLEEYRRLTAEAKKLQKLDYLAESIGAIV